MRKGALLFILSSFVADSDPCAYWYGTNNVYTLVPYFCYQIIKRQNITTLSELNISVPFTYVETFTSFASDCPTDPATITEWRTALANGTSYTGY